MGWYQDYIQNVAKDNRSFYEEFVQESINSQFEDTTLVRMIEEEKYPFNQEYEQYEVQIDSVAEITVNIIKVIGDFITVLFKDCSHKNLRGQKYIYNGETYLCYDKINELAKVAETRLIRCNNEISWLDENANVLKEKIFLGYELSSTNDSVGKDGIVSNRRLVIYVQYNDRTKTIKTNQRFMFGHNQCFRVEEVDNYNVESGVGEPTMMRLNLVYSTLLPKDNKELNICDYYDLDYKIEIDQESVEQTNGFLGKFNAILKNGEEIVEDKKLIWLSKDSSVVEVEEDGSYSVIGTEGQTTVIECFMEDNPNIKDEVIITVVEDLPQGKELFVSPIINELKERKSVLIKTRVLSNGQDVDQDIDCVTNWENRNNYTLEKTDEGYLLTNVKMIKKPLELTFSSEDCEDVVLNISLVGLI